MGVAALLLRTSLGQAAPSALQSSPSVNCTSTAVPAIPPLDGFLGEIGAAKHWLTLSGLDLAEGEYKIHKGFHRFSL